MQSSSIPKRDLPLVNEPRISSLHLDDPKKYCNPNRNLSYCWVHDFWRRKKPSNPPCSSWFGFWWVNESFRSHESSLQRGRGSGGLVSNSPPLLLKSWRERKKPPDIGALGQSTNLSFLWEDVFLKSGSGVNKVISITFKVLSHND